MTQAESVKMLYESKHHPLTRIIKDLENSDDFYHQMNLLMLRNCSFGNFLDRCAVSLPIHEPETAPVGLMVMGESDGDDRLLEIAKTIETAIKR